jgi:phosphoribosyl-AMP cyclohydrolase / phosphoribosyl-ATP pyrophosphohydrolase
MTTPQPNFSKDPGGLLPAIIQDADTRVVLMQGFMNEESYAETINKGLVTFYSRSKQRLWTKGEESGNVLKVVSIHLDCDADSILIKVQPHGPTCHTGAATCWNEPNEGYFLQELERVIQSRVTAAPDSSYTAQLLSKGINKVAQKVGEEAVELVIESKDNNKELFMNEAADLMYHYLVLLTAKGYRLDDVIDVLKLRHKK